MSKEVKRKVAIVGYAPSSRDKAPFNDTSVEIWGVNEAYKVMPRVDVLFEIHDRYWLTQKERNPQHLEWLQNASIPIYMIDHYDDIPTSVRFPIETMLREFGDYFTNSISYMIALAIFLRFDEIQIFGVDMAADSEYGTQRPSCEYFIGLARGRGINVYLPPECDLCRTFYLYGYDDREATELAKRLKAREAELAARVGDYARQENEARRGKDQLAGALDDLRYWKARWLYAPSGEQLIKNRDTVTLNFDEKPTDEFMEILTQHQGARGIEQGEPEKIPEKPKRKKKCT